MEGYPREGELVVCKIRRIERYGVFVDLIEYNKEGFVHISNITSGWVKNIRSHVSEGQLRVGYVVRVDKAKNLIDISFRKVRPNQERRRMEEWKKGKHAMKVINKVADDLGESFTDSIGKVVPPLEEVYGELYAALEACSIDGHKALEGIKIPDNWKKALVEEARRSITPPSVQIDGKLTMQFYSPDGVEKVKQVAKEIASNGVSIGYVSAPQYSISITARDYPTAEKILGNAMEQAEKQVKSHGGLFEFKR